MFLVQSNANAENVNQYPMITTKKYSVNIPEFSYRCKKSPGFVCLGYVSVNIQCRMKAGLVISISRLFDHFSQISILAAGRLKVENEILDTQP
jgi:hypothetical protein